MPNHILFWLCGYFFINKKFKAYLKLISDSFYATLCYSIIKVIIKVNLSKWIKTQTTQKTVITAIQLFAHLWKAPQERSSFPISRNPKNKRKNNLKPEHSLNLKLETSFPSLTIYKLSLKAFKASNNITPSKLQISKLT